jgi:hypothetical protein
MAISISDHQDYKHNGFQRAPVVLMGFWSPRERADLNAPNYLAILLAYSLLCISTVVVTNTLPLASSTSGIRPEHLDPLYEPLDPLYGRWTHFMGI